MTLSTIGVLCQLGATVRLRDELESWVPGFLPIEDLPDQQSRNLGFPDQEPTGQDLTEDELLDDRPA